MEKPPSGVQYRLLPAGQWEALRKAFAEEERWLADSGLQVVHGFVDHAAWMQRCSMVVHHGGMGTMLAALGAGLPAVACPLHFDQHQNVRSLLQPLLSALRAISDHSEPDPSCGLKA